MTPYCQGPSLPPLTLADQSELAARAQAGDLAAEGQLVTRNLGLIVLYITPTLRRSRDADHEDIIAAAVSSFRASIPNYDPTYGCTLVRYARRAIRTAAVRAARRCACVVHLPDQCWIGDDPVAANVSLVHISDPDTATHLPPAVGLDPAAAMMTADDAHAARRRLLTAVDRLPPPLRRTVRALCLSGPAAPTQSAFAAAEGISPQAISHRMIRARTVLRRLVQEDPA